MGERRERISRRSFLGKGLASVVGAGIGLAGVTQEGESPSSGSPQEGTAQEPGKPAIREYRTLGRTGYKVSDISFGNGAMHEPSLLEYAIDRGINYVDTARQYYEMEVVIGKIFPAKRDKLFVTTKLMPELFTASVTAEEITKAIEESLTRLNTDHIDCCMIHSVGEDAEKPDRTRIESPGIYAAFETAKKDGKIRFWGASSHGPRMIEEFTWLIENTDIDLIMPGMNYMTKGLEPVLAKAKEKNIAVVAMKSLSAARKIDYSAYAGHGKTARQALLKWMLAQPHIDTITVTMRTFDEIDELVAASGKPGVSAEEKEILEGYRMLLDPEYCRPGCGTCLSSCPYKVPVHDILRYRLYFTSYGREKYAMGLYARLPVSRSGARCLSCEGPCAGGCPHGIPIRTKLIEAHTTLTA
jgi:predicted aldo/keto reductase-like oxidoreductase